MKSTTPDPSPLRQLIDMLGAQIDTPADFDPALVIAICNKLSMAASDNKTPIPDDIFAPGIHDMLMRLCIGHVAGALAQSAARTVKTNPPPSK